MRKRSIYNSRSVILPNSNISKVVPSIKRENTNLLEAYLNSRNPESRAILSDLLVKEDQASRDPILNREGQVDIIVRYVMSPWKVLWINSYQKILDDLYKNIIETTNSSLFENIKNGFFAFLSDLRWDFGVDETTTEKLLDMFEYTKKELLELETTYRSKNTFNYSLEVENDDIVKYSTEILSRNDEFYFKDPLLNRKIEIIKIIFPY